MRHRSLRFAYFVSILVGAALACNVVSQARDVRGTAQSVVTQAQGLATQGEILIATVQGFATQNPGLINTAQAFITEQGPAMLSTAQAFATQNPGMIETAQAMVTQGFVNNEVPADIPVIQSAQVESLVGSVDTVTYSTPAAFSDVVSFYKEQMPAYGWTSVPENNMETENVVIMNFQKPERNVSITLSSNPVDEKTYVAIFITNR